MRGIIRKAIVAVICMSVILLSGCGLSAQFLRAREQGLYPDAGDFPNTKWRCREIDMDLYMFGYEEKYIIGTYTVSGNSYRVVATFIFDRFDFEIYSHTQVSKSEHSDAMLHCNRVSYGFISTKYLFDKDTGTIICSLLNYETANKENIPETLTFEKVGDIAQERDKCWYAQNPGMYLYSFNDVEGYFSGEISIAGEGHYIHAFEIGNDGYYMVSIENGKVNNLRPGTTSPLICVYLEKRGEEIIATVSDEYITNAIMFPYWTHNDVIITFNPS